MTPTEIAAQRVAVVREALSWQRTPFADCAGLKGVGTDCANFPHQVYMAAGAMPRCEIPVYSPQFLLHSNEERYIAVVEQHAVEIAGPPQPGDLVLWKFGRCFSHGAIVIDWDRIIHAHKIAGGVIQDDAERSGILLALGNGRPRPRRFFTLKAWSAA